MNDIGQVIQRVEVFTRTTNSRVYQQYGTGQRFLLICLNIEIEVHQLYRRLSIPVVFEPLEENSEL